MNNCASTFLLLTIVVMLIIIGSSYCNEEIKEVQTRGVYEDIRAGPPPPNDFSLSKRPSEVNRYHQYHNPDGPYHHYHGYHSGGYAEPHYHRHESFPNRPAPYDDDDDDRQFNSSGSGIPLDFARSLNDYIVSDLLLNVIEDGPENEEKPLLLANRFGADEGNETERNAATLARPAKCIPELTTVRIAESKDRNIFYVPECTRVERCGGCCSHTLLACQPVETETVTFSVMKTEYTGNLKLKYVGMEPVLVEKHTKCKCGCKIKAQDCNNYQEYRESECRCVCKNLDEEKKCYKNTYKKLWNQDLCACQCRDVQQCSTGFQFDYNECRCVQSQLKRRYVLTDIHKEQQQHPDHENTD